MSWYGQITEKFVRNVAVKYMQSVKWSSFNVFPRLGVQQVAGYIAKYEKEHWMRVGNPDDYIRVGATESVGDSGSVGQQEYVLQPFAYHEDASKDDRKNYDNPFDPVRDRTESVVNRLRLLSAKQFANVVFKTGVWGTEFDVNTSGAGGKWSTSTGKPINDVLTVAKEIESFTGLWPNKICMTRDVEVGLETNAQIRDAMKVTEDKVVTKDLLARLFKVDAVEVFNVVETTAKKGKSATTANTGYMAQNMLVLVYAPKRAGIRTPSAGYSLVYAGAGDDVRVRTIRIPEKNDALRVEGEIEIKPLIVAPDLGALFTNVV